MYVKASSWTMNLRRWDLPAHHKFSKKFLKFWVIKGFNTWQPRWRAKIAHKVHDYAVKQLNKKGINNFIYYGEGGTRGLRGRGANFISHRFTYENIEFALKTPIDRFLGPAQFIVPIEFNNNEQKKIGKCLEKEVFKTVPSFATKLIKRKLTNE